MVFAAPGDSPFIYIPKPGDPNLVTPETNFILYPENWVITLINIIFIAVIAFSTISTIVSGIRYTTARGDIKALQVAKASLIYSIVALVGGLAGFTLLNVVVNVFNVSNKDDYLNYLQP